MQSALCFWFLLVCKYVFFPLCGAPAYEYITMYAFCRWSTCGGLSGLGLLWTKLLRMSSYTSSVHTAHVFARDTTRNGRTGSQDLTVFCLSSFCQTIFQSVCVNYASSRRTSEFWSMSPLRLGVVRSFNSDTNFYPSGGGGKCISLTALITDDNDHLSWADGALG